MPRPPIPTDRPPIPTARPIVVAPLLGRGRRARLVVRTVDPFSVLRTLLLYSLSLAVVGIIAVAILWVILTGLGAFTSIASAIDTVNFSGPGTGKASAGRFFGAVPIIGGASVLLAINALLLTALATLAAFLYNLCASFTGGIEVTMAESE
jgi:hypothetical protein